MIRFFDVSFSLLGLLITLPIMLLIFLASVFDTGHPIFRQRRVGKNKVAFTLVKFRTMRVGTESMATHLSSASSITKLGAFLRKTKLDELPQLWNVLKGEMSLVGPRPCLFSQLDLIERRSARGVYDVRPGITGLAQVGGIDMSTPELLAETDQKMIQGLTVRTYFKYIIMTVAGNGRGDRIGKS